MICRRGKDKGSNLFFDFLGTAWFAWAEFVLAASSTCKRLARTLAMANLPLCGTSVHSSGSLSLRSPRSSKAVSPSPCCVAVCGARLGDGSREPHAPSRSVVCAHRDTAAPTARVSSVHPMSACPASVAQSASRFETEANWRGDTVAASGPSAPPGHCRCSA